ncbi:hypothetical protein [Actinoalloteichus spitiensis]|uniref:hypothetical protein n=1 Tax=Actinoalloteichus spitiensis TaxID=252394 RepID=UPI00035F3D12|nr:hypothetical protein [Actinoalloteichus spitiensis]
MRSAFGQDFAVPVGYLNTASIGIPPTLTSDAVERDVRDWARGRSTAPGYDRWVAEARAAFASLVGVATGDVAEGASASQLVGLVAASLPPGTRVLTATGDFTSVTFPFAAQRDRGVTTTEVGLDDLVPAAEDHDLVAVSAVQSADGRIVDLEGLRAVAERGTPVLLDVTQAAGWLPLRLDWADWVVCAGYKWLLCPRGSAWMALSERARSRTVPHAANWYAGEDPWRTVYGLPLRLAPDARAYDISPVWLAQVGAAHSLPWLAGLDLDEVSRYVVGLAARFRAELGLDEGDSPIVSVPAPGPISQVMDLLTGAGVRCAQRAGALRFSFHLYNTEEDVLHAVHALRASGSRSAPEVGPVSAAP